MAEVRKRTRGEIDVILGQWVTDLLIEYREDDELVPWNETVAQAADAHIVRDGYPSSRPPTNGLGAEVLRQIALRVQDPGDPLILPG